jgi:hypothetical protein
MTRYEASEAINIEELVRKLAAVALGTYVTAVTHFRELAHFRACRKVSHGVINPERGNELGSQGVHSLCMTLS